MYEIRKREDGTWCIYLENFNVVVALFAEYVGDSDIKEFSVKTGIPIRGNHD